VARRLPVESANRETPAQKALRVCQPYSPKARTDEKMKRHLIVAIGAVALQSCIHSPTPVAATPQHEETLAFRAEPVVIAPGEESTLRWNMPGVTRVLIEEAAGFQHFRQLGMFANPGSVKVRPLEDSTYVISCSSGSSTTCESVNVRVRVRRR
jgi:hypothetical protein